MPLRPALVRRTAEWIEVHLRDVPCAPGFDWFMPRTRYIVLRGTGDCRYEGLWLDRPTMPIHAIVDDHCRTVRVSFTHDGTYERRADGILAAVYRPTKVEAP